MHKLFYTTGLMFLVAFTFFIAFDTNAQDQSLPDLVVESVQFNEEWKGFKKVLVASVCNRGTVAVNAPLRVQFTIQGEHRLFGGSAPFPLAVGACLETFSMLEFYKTLSPTGSSQFEVTVKADANSSGLGDNAIEELDETNNSMVRVLGLTVPEKPDLVIENVIVDTTPSAGGEYPVSVNIANRGSGSVGYSFTVIMLDGTTGQRYASVEEVSLVTASPYSRSRPFPPYSSRMVGPWSLLPGSHKLTITIDGSNMILETDETNNSLVKEIEIQPSNSQEKPKPEPGIPVNSKPKPTLPSLIPPDPSLTNRLKGSILLAVESNGEAWYVDHTTGKRFYLKDGTAAFSALKKFGTGISNVNLDQIPVGFEDRFKDVDSDSDGLSDKLEEALGTNPSNSDSDGDSYPDGHEVKNGYRPNGAGKYPVSNLCKQLEGKIMLQVESRGQAWYIRNCKRYYLKDGEASYQIMRFLSLGIKNSDLQKITVGEM